MVSIRVQSFLRIYLHSGCLLCYFLKDKLAKILLKDGNLIVFQCAEIWATMLRLLARIMLANLRSNIGKLVPCSDNIAELALLCVACAELARRRT